MKTKQEILTALAHSGDDKLLLAGLLDKEQTCEQRGYLTPTKFLDLKQRALCTDAVRLAGATGLRSARLSVLRNVIGESRTGVSPVL